MKKYLHSDRYNGANGTVVGHEALMMVDTGLATGDPSGQQPVADIYASILDTWNLTHADGFTESVAVSLGPASHKVSSFAVVPDRRNPPYLESTGPDMLLSHGALNHFVWALDFDHYRL